MTDPVDMVLARLDSAREVAPGRWRARCPAHDGKSTSALSITRGDDGRVLLHCFAGCDVESIAEAIGLQLHDLFVPVPAEHRAGPMRQRFVPAQVFDILRAEVGVVVVIAGDMHRQREVTPADYERLRTCVDRLDDIARGAYGRR